MAEVLPLTKKIATTRDFLEKMKGQLALALPRHVTSDRMIRVVLTECLTSVQRARSGAPTLLDCTQESFAGAVLQCAALGLEPGVLGQAFLIPFRNNRRGTIECQLIPGYKGLLMLARRSGQIQSIDPVIVHAKDKFTVRKGTAPQVLHDPYRPKADDDDHGPAVAYYAVAALKGGGFQFDYMWKADVQRHRERYSRASEDGPWVTNFDEMGLKTVLRRLSKFLPVSVETQTAIALDEAHEAGLPQDLGMIWSAQAEGYVPQDAGAASDWEAPAAAPAPASKLDAAVAQRQATAAPATESAPAAPPPAAPPAEAKKRGRPPRAQGEAAVNDAVALSETTMREIERQLAGLASAEALDAWELAAYELDGIYAKLLPRDRLACNKLVTSLRTKLAA
jgi:recombination protein RecT